MLSWLIPEAHAQAQTSQADGLIQVGMIVFMLVVFYFVLIRPQQKRQKEHKNMLDAVEVGDEVSTHAGLLGKVRKIEDAYIVLKVADNVELRFQKSAIAAILPKGTLKSIGWYAGRLKRLSFVSWEQANSQLAASLLICLKALFDSFC